MLASLLWPTERVQHPGFSYSAYRLRLRSAIELPELPPAAEDGPADAQITWGPVRRWLPQGADPEGSVLVEGEAVRIVVPGAGAILVTGGQSIVADPDPGAEERVLRLFLLGGALGILLHQRGLTTLHASAVAAGAGAAIFVGDSGEGKSTMAAALNGLGLPLLADDVVAFDLSGPDALVLPAFPQLKLWPDSAEALGADLARMRLVHPDLTKRARPAEGSFPAAPLPAHAIYVLETSERTAITRLGPTDAFAEVKRFAYALGLLGPAGTTATHFHRLVALAGRVPVYRLERPHEFRLLPTVAALTTDHLAQAAALAREARQ